jgi:hypothetical protein
MLAEHVRSLSIEVSQAGMKAVVEPAKQDAEGHASSTSRDPRNDENGNQLSARRMGDANINMNCDTRQREVRPDAGMDMINSYDANPEPSQLVGNDEDTILNPGRWLSICLR